MITVLSRLSNQLVLRSSGPNPSKLRETLGQALPQPLRTCTRHFNRHCPGARQIGTSARPSHRRLKRGIAGCVWKKAFMAASGVLTSVRSAARAGAVATYSAVAKGSSGRGGCGCPSFPGASREALAAIASIQNAAHVGAGKGRRRVSVCRTGTESSGPHRFGTFSSRDKLSNAAASFGSSGRGMKTIRAAGAGSQSEQAGGVAVVGEDPVYSYQWKNGKNPRICILGGGFGGLYTALRLESLTWEPHNRPQVLLIDQNDRFVFKPMLYELLSKEVDEWEIAPTFLDLLSDTQIKFIKDSVKAVSPADSLYGRSANGSQAEKSGGTVFLDGGVQVDYDWLVLALGAEAKINLVPGALENALPFVTLEDALEVDRRLVALERERFGMQDVPIEVVIVGSGYSGVELAATVAERLGKRGTVKIVDPNPNICASAPPGNREVAAKILSSRGVQLELGYFVAGISSSSAAESGLEGNGSTSASTSPRQVRLDLTVANQRQSSTNKVSKQLEADLILWTVGSQATVPNGPDSEHVAFPVNGRGQADTDETLRVKGHPRIFAVGDSAGTKDSSGKLLPATAQVAFQQADYAGWNLWAAINDRPLLPFRYQHLGEMMTLGRTDAAVSFGFIDNVTLDGFLAHTARKLAYLYRLPKDDHKAKVALSWFAKSTISTFSFLQDELTKVLSPR